MTSRNKLNAACLQLNTSDDIEANFNRIEHLLDTNKKPLDLLILPENAVLISSDLAQKSLAAQHDSIFKITQRFAKIAKEHSTWLVAGSILTADEQQPNKFKNRCFTFSPDGKIVGFYDKMHLFDADLTSESWKESKNITAGEKPVQIEIDNNWKIGLSICYDLRFPELYRFYSNMGCNILTVPAAFTVPTGKAHWHTLLKARAIENQAYVLAAGQYGTHTDGRQTYGHSIIINPWGEILAELSNGEGLVYAELNMDFLAKLKTRMPVLKHRHL